jgi:hypothetical protein
MLPQSVYEWLGNTSLSHFFQDSTYTFPVTEVLHLIGLMILLGTTTVVCLRLLGYGLPQAASTIHAGIWAWTWIGLALVFSTGIVLLVGEPGKLASNVAFAYKLWFLAAGLALHFLGYLYLLRPGRSEAHPLLSKLVAVLVIVCWFGAGVAGRAIGFV